MQVDKADEVRRAILGAVTLGLVTALAVLVFDRVWAEEPGQPWLVRWLRLAAEHPVRMGFAGAGFCLACSRTWCPDSPTGTTGSNSDN